MALASLVGVSSLCAQDAPATPATPALPELTEAEAKEISSFLLGLRSSSNFAGAGLTVDDLDIAQISKGFIAGLNGEKPTYPEPKMQAAMKALGDKVQARAAKKAETNLTEGKAFLAENGKRKGVTTTASGLQYEVITAGTDKKYVAPADGAPDMATKFMINYRGTLIDGTEFDKSQEGKPFAMTLQVIPGFKEALTTMPVGAKWKLFIPSDLAYGARPAGPQIAANSTLIFELELVEIQTPAPAPAPASAVTPPVSAPVTPEK